jgi:hypothetical protein
VATRYTSSALATRAWAGIAKVAAMTAAIERTDLNMVDLPLKFSLHFYGGKEMPDEFSLNNLY